jgi:hypothetical protein
MLIKLLVPRELEFAELALERESVTLRLLFAPGPLAVLCLGNGLDLEAFLANADLSCWMITEWYCSHREAGGEPDPVAEKILAEVAANTESGIAVLQQGGRREH